MSTIGFKPYNERVPVRVYYTHLPHWRQNGATYFVTFRLGDALPRRLLESWRLELVSWLTAHGISYDPKTWPTQLRTLPIDLQQRYSKLAGSRLDKYLDQGAGLCLLANPAIRDIVQTGLHYFDGKRLSCGDYVIMPNHIHWLVKPAPGHQLEDCLKSLKSFLAKQINRQRKSTGRVWQHSSYDHIVRDLAELHYYRQYIQNNPSKADIAASQSTVFDTEWRLIEAGVDD